MRNARGTLSVPRASGWLRIWSRLRRLGARRGGALWRRLALLRLFAAAGHGADLVGDRGVAGLDGVAGRLDRGVVAGLDRVTGLPGVRAGVLVEVGGLLGDLPAAVAARLRVERVH